MNTIQNKLNIIGRIGVTPSIKTFDNGAKLAKFTIATNETVSDQNGKTIKTQWHNIIAWGKQADLVEKYIKNKGLLVSIEGRLVNRVFVDPSGISKKVTEIQLEDLIIIKPNPLLNKKS
jgi:single-strand DNA-binding protein